MFLVYTWSENKFVRVHRVVEYAKDIRTGDQESERQRARKRWQKKTESASARIVFWRVTIDYDKNKTTIERVK